MQRDFARGYTHATLDDQAALWVGALRWRQIERNARAEIVKFHEGAESTTHLCETVAGRIVGLSIDASGDDSWALFDEGRIFKLSPQS